MVYSSWIAAGARRFLLLCGACIAATTLVVQSLPAAASGLQNQDPNCATVSPAASNITFDEAFFNQLTSIKASSKGRTGVFFLTGQNGRTFVFKFEDSINAGAVVSRKLLKTLGMPVDTLNSSFVMPTEISYRFNKMMEASRRNGVVTEANKTRFKALTNRLQTKFTRNNPPALLMVTEFLRGYRGASSLADALELPDAIPAPQKLEITARFAAALNALAAPSNQRLLGYLFMADAWMGNVDRLTRPFPNIDNIFLAEGNNATPCLVAIDNEAHAPSPEYLAMVNYANNIRFDIEPSIPENNGSELHLKEYQGVIRFQRNGTRVRLNLSSLDLKWLYGFVANRAQPIRFLQELKPTNGQTVVGDAFQIAPQDYMTALMGRYSDVMGSAAPEIFGPAAILDFSAFNGPGSPAVEQTGVGPENCQDGLTNTRPVPPGTKRIIRFLRTKLALKVLQNAQKASQRQFNMGVSYTASGPTFPNQLNTIDFANATRMCQTVISISNGFITIDWRQFEQNFMEGVADATADFGDPAYLTRAMANAFPGGAADVSLYLSSDVSHLALTSRAQYFDKLSRGKNHQQAIGEILAGVPYNNPTFQYSVAPGPYVSQTVRDVQVWMPTN